MRVLVTGATGCLGGAVARRFALDGAEVTASGRNPDVGRRLAAEGLRWRPAELTDGLAVDRLVDGHEVIVHCGGLSSTWGTADAFRLANVEGTRHVAEAAIHHGVRRVVFISTPSVYFDGTDQLALVESHPFPTRRSHPYAASRRAAEELPSDVHPYAASKRAAEELPADVHPYAASKRAAEGLLADAHRRRGLGVVTLRPRAIFGPYDAALLPRLLRVAAHGWLPLIDGGRALVDITYVDNVVDAVVAAASGPASLDGRVYNITNGEHWTVAALFAAVADAFNLRVRLVRIPYRIAYSFAASLELGAHLRPGCPEPALTRHAVDLLARSQTLSIQAARQDLAYAPRVTVAEGLQRTAAWWNTSRAGSRSAA